MANPTKCLASFNSTLLFATSIWCLYINNLFYASLMAVTCLVSYFLWTKYLTTKEALATLLLTIGGILLFLRWNVILGLEVVFFSMLPVLFQRKRTKYGTVYFYTFMVIQTLCMFALLILSYYEAVDGILSLEHQNESIISNILEILHCAPENESYVGGEINPTKGTISAQVENIPIYNLIRSTAQATVGTCLLKASSVSGPDFGATKAGVMAAKTFKVTKIAACISGSYALGCSFFDVVWKK